MNHILNVIVNENNNIDHYKSIVFWMAAIDMDEHQIQYAGNFLKLVLQERGIDPAEFSKELG
jgi:hypothetical protein